MSRLEGYFFKDTRYNKPKASTTKSFEQNSPTKKQEADKIFLLEQNNIHKTHEIKRNIVKQNAKSKRKVLRESVSQKNNSAISKSLFYLSKYSIPVVQLKQFLNQSQKSNLPIDNNFDVKTLNAVILFQRNHKEKKEKNTGRFAIDGIVGPKTIQQMVKLGLFGKQNQNNGSTTRKVDMNPQTKDTSGRKHTPIKALSQTEKASGNKNIPYESGDKSRDTTVGIKGESLLKNAQFMQKVQAISSRLGVSSNQLIAVMRAESRLDPTVINPGGTKATGLIQFTKDTARGLGTSVQQIRRMSALRQLDYVQKFYLPLASKIKNGIDLYLATFYPAGLGKHKNYQLGGKKVSKQNPSIAKHAKKNGRTIITVADFEKYARSKGLS